MMEAVKAKDAARFEPNILSKEQIEAYARDGSIGVASLVGEEWIGRLRAVTDEFVALSREVGADGFKVGGSGGEKNRVSTISNTAS